MGIIKNINAFFAKRKEEREAEELKEKERIVALLSKPMSDKEVESYNISLIANSAGWVGGNYSERDIKLDILSGKRDLFTEEELAELRKSLK